MILAPISKEVGDPGVVECIIIVIMIMQRRFNCMRTLSKFRMHEEGVDCSTLCSKSSLLEVGSKSPTINDAYLAGLGGRDAGTIVGQEG